MLASLCARLPGTKLRLKRLGHTRAAGPNSLSGLPPTQPADAGDPLEPWPGIAGQPLMTVGRADSGQRARMAAAGREMRLPSDIAEGKARLLLLFWS